MRPQRSPRKSPRPRHPRKRQKVEPKAEGPTEEPKEEPKAEAPRQEAKEEPRAEAPKAEAKEEPKAEGPRNTKKVEDVSHEGEQLTFQAPATASASVPAATLATATTEVESKEAAKRFIAM